MQDLQGFLDGKVEQYNSPGFITLDPISIPHRFSKKQDIEISGFFASILAWGQRKTIINKCIELFEMMDNSPHDFLLNHQEDDLKPFLNFKHRTFNDVDTLYFIHFLSWFYKKHTSLEEAFLLGQTGGIDLSMRPACGSGRSKAWVDYPKANRLVDSFGVNSETSGV